MYLVIVNLEDTQEFSTYGSRRNANAAFEERVSEGDARSIILIEVSEGDDFGFGEHGYWGRSPLDSWYAED
jgi:hypothetical protein